MPTVSNGHTSGYSMDHSNDYVNGYANGHTHGEAVANGRWKEEMDNAVVVMRRPSPLEYPFLIVKAVQVVCPRHLFFRFNTNCLSSFGQHARYLGHQCEVRLDGRL
jgi:hypothetical protein